MNSQKFVLEAYRAILRREPTKREVSEMKVKLLTGTQARFHLLRDMVDSDEFRVHILPGLVVQQTQLSSEPVFFLHIPKTGGTSMRELIGDALGVPSINIYDGWLRPSVGHGYWPYWAGHAQVSFFPESHKGITFFRDTKSRTLSRYRQLEKGISNGQIHGWSYPRSRGKRKKEIMPFSVWLDFIEDNGIRSLEYYLAENKKVVTPEMAPKESREFRNLDIAERRIQLESGMSRFSCAAWIHKENDVRMAISRVVGKPVDSLPRHNTFESKDFSYSDIVLTESDLKTLKLLEERDELVFKIAADLGLIQLLPRDENESLFEKTVSRLKFKL